MSDDESHDDIGQIEARIEALGDSIERCVKFSLAAKLAIAAGATWIALLLLSVVWFAPETFIGAMAAVLIGTVLLGSNATTWTQAEADLRAAEAMRADLIGRIDMRVVGEERPTLH